MSSGSPCSWTSVGQGGHRPTCLQLLNISGDSLSLVSPTLLYDFSEVQLVIVEVEKRFQRDVSLSAFVPLITFFLSFTPLLFWTLKSVADTSSLIGRCIGHLFSFDDCHHNNSGAKTVYKVSTNDQSHSQIVGPSSLVSRTHIQTHIHNVPM